MSLDIGKINTNMMLAFAAIVGLGVLVKFELLTDEFASLALGALLGAGATKAPNIIKPAPPAEEPPAEVPPAEEPVA